MKKLAYIALVALTVLSISCSKEPTELSITPSDVTLKVGDSVELALTVKPKKSDLSSVVWTALPEDVVSVNEEGKVKALQPGAAVVTATTENGVVATCNVTVDGFNIVSKVLVVQNGDTKVVKIYTAEDYQLETTSSLISLKKNEDGLWQVTAAATAVSAGKGYVDAIVKVKGSEGNELGQITVRILEVLTVSYSYSQPGDSEVYFAGEILRLHGVRPIDEWSIQEVTAYNAEKSTPAVINSNVSSTTLTLGVYYDSEGNKIDGEIIIKGVDEYGYEATTTVVSRQWTPKLYTIQSISGGVRYDEVDPKTVDFTSQETFGIALVDASGSKFLYNDWHRCYMSSNVKRVLEFSYETCPGYYYQLYKQDQDSNHYWARVTCTEGMADYDISIRFGQKSEYIQTLDFGDNLPSL